ncbi:hypothetical protein U1Q18_037346, partial [Sarracenia purpurea var. burkii]
ALKNIVPSLVSSATWRSTSRETSSPRSNCFKHETLSLGKSVRGENPIPGLCTSVESNPIWLGLFRADRLNMSRSWLCISGFIQGLRSDLGTDQSEVSFVDLRYC